MEKWVEDLRKMGFSNAAIMDVKDLVFVPEYRKYCEMNLCGNYGLAPSCPPKCGSPEQMNKKMLQYEKALILQTEQPLAGLDMKGMKLAQIKHNVLAEKIVNRLRKEKKLKVLFMSSGPWKKYSCLSAYCIDSQKMAESLGMKAWEQDGNLRCFSLILF